MREREILVSAGCSADVVAHCEKVARMAISIAEQMKQPVDRELVLRGGLLHDIGRSRTHNIDHAVVGVEIGRQLGFGDDLINMIERHIGAGITAAESERLGLPKKDYMPMTREEHIVSYADNLISGVREMPFFEALDRFKRILGPDHEGIELFRKQHALIQQWMK